MDIAAPRDRRNMPAIKKGTKIDRSNMISPHLRFPCCALLKGRPAPFIVSKWDSEATSAAADGRERITAIKVRVTSGPPALRPRTKFT
jgi:hypothetical protein